MFLKKFRSKRGDKALSTKKSIFRSSKKQKSGGEENAGGTLIAPSITWTMSEDISEEETHQESNVGSSGMVVFTEAQLMQHELSHMRQLEELKQANAKTAKQHAKAMAELQEKHELAKQMLLIERERSLKLESELIERKQDLCQVSSELIKTQHKLHDYEMKYSWFSWF